MPESAKELSGRELNFAIAEKVMEWKRGTRYGNGNGEWVIPNWKEVLPLTWSRTPRFCESIEAAMRVVEKLWQMDWQVEMVNCHKPETLITENACWWYVRFINNENDMNNWSAEADLLPEAICRAALAVIESKTA